MSDLLARLTSRKFLLTVAAVTTALANHNVWAAVAAVLTYVGVEGAIDHKTAPAPVSNNNEPVAP